MRCKTSYLDSGGVGQKRATNCPLGPVPEQQAAYSGESRLSKATQHETPTSDPIAYSCVTVSNASSAIMREAGASCRSYESLMVDRHFNYDEFAFSLAPYLHLGRVPESNTFPLRYGLSVHR